MKPLVLELVAGTWQCGCRSEDVVDAAVTFTTEPSPKTGHVGWVWWARGRMGEAPSLSAAVAAAERSSKFPACGARGQ